MIEVLIAIKEPLLQLGTSAALAESDDCRVVGRVEELEAVESTARELEPDVVILDVAFQREDRDLIPRLTEDHAGVNVLVLVEHSDEECALRALLSDPKAARFSEDALEHLDECCLTSLRSSARGCVPRTSDPRRLLHAVRTVAAGEIAAAPWLTAALGPGPTGGGADAPAPISARELEVIGLVADGMGNKQIARELEIREQTVKNHLASVMRKLGVNSRLEVGLHAVRQHLKPPPRKRREEGRRKRGDSTGGSGGVVGRGE